MTLKEQNTLLISLAVIGSCVFVIPTGISRGWPFWLVVATIVIFCLTCYIVGWNTGYAFRTIPLEKLSSKEKAFHFLSFFMFILGIPSLMGLYADSYWLRAAGAILMLVAALIQRRVIKSIPKDDLQDNTAGNN